MAQEAPPEVKPRGAIDPQLLISADSHVVEPRDLWATRLPINLRDHAPVHGKRTQDRSDRATDPADRLSAMQADGVSMEVLYPTYGLEHFRIADQALQEACFRVYNDWLVEYCAGTPGRLVGIASIPTYDIDRAIAELERTHAAGLTGCEIWHVPPQQLSFASEHYERLWDACEEVDAPVHLHITSGFVNWIYERGTTEQYRPLVEFKTAEAIHALFDFIFYGVLERHPRLKLVLVEFEIGWIPWVLQQWDYYAHRFANDNPTFGPKGLSLLPSEYFTRQVFTTFFNDAVGTLVFQHGWGIGNCMWSNDFPHFNSSWPNSRDVIQRDLGPLGEAERSRLIRENVAALYHLEIPPPIQKSATLG